MHVLFATEVQQSKLKFNLKELKTEAHQIKKADKSGREWSKINYPNGYTSYGSWDQLNHLSSTFADLEKLIAKEVLSYAQGLDYDLKKGDLVVNSLWVNIMGKGAQHTAHIHPHSIISGTFYVDIPKGSSTIKFEDPRFGLFMNSPNLKKTAKQSRQRFVSLTPRSGDLILFESWLRHEVPRQNCREERVSISFNYGWSRG